MQAENNPGSVVAMLAELCGNDLIIMNLGAAEDRDFALAPEVRAITTLIEVDATNESKTTHNYYRRIRLNTVVADKAGQRTFYRRAYPMCSSLLDVNHQRAEDYGLQALVELMETSDVECQSVGQVLEAIGLARIDFLKTDVEGMDSTIVKESVDAIPRLLAIQSELRFQPFYVGEPYFHETAALCHERGFELITLKPHYWKLSLIHI